MTAIVFFMIATFTLFGWIVGVWLPMWLQTVIAVAVITWLTSKDCRRLEIGVIPVYLRWGWFFGAMMLADAVWLIRNFHVTRGFFGVICELLTLGL